MNSPIAHSRNALGLEQPLVEHLSSVAHFAALFAAPFGAERSARLLGWLHDVGKLAEDVQAYLKAPNDASRGPDHSSVGMLMALDVYEPLAFNAAGHHGGLPDLERLRERIQRKRKEDRICDALRQARLFLEAQPDYQPSGLPLGPRGSSPDTRRNAEFRTRMLHSALVDADALDAEAHSSPQESASRVTSPAIAKLSNLFEQSQRQLMHGKTGDVNRMRAKVYEACLNAAEMPQGVFSLTVPTGGGKTRSSMAFALRHALCHDLRRVIVALPYTSIIEQNAQVYRGIFGDRAVLEHHSSVRRSRTTEEAEATEAWRRLASDNWDAHIVVTTTVQLLESLFTNQNGRCRKLHNIVDTVVILDEVQTLPPHLLKPTLDILQHLVDDYGVTLVLSTATQPSFLSRDGFEGLKAVREIIPNCSQIFGGLRRASYELPRQEKWNWDRVAGEAGAHSRVLIIVNTIHDAQRLLDSLDRTDVLHLSTRLCAMHRRAILAEVHRRLNREIPVCLVSTQVVEAGVDIDFPVVFRAIGPLDRIIQAAGRCNREGKLESGHVVVFDPVQGHMPLGAYKTGADVTRALLAEDPGVQFDDPGLPIRYFQRLYDARDLDKRDIQGLRARFQFEQTAAAYRLIEEDTIAVVVPFEDDQLEERERRLQAIAARGWAHREDIRFFQPLLVNLRESVLRDNATSLYCVEIAPDFWAWRGEYDPIRGLVLPAPPMPDSTIW